MSDSINAYLADLPSLVTAELLAQKLGIDLETVYQRHWRKNKNPDACSHLLPPSFNVGGKKLVFLKVDVVNWLSHPLPRKTSIKTSTRGRPTISARLGKAKHATNHYA
jgi:hypothetical protein